MTERTPRPWDSRRASDGMDGKWIQAILHERRLSLLNADRKVTGKSARFIAAAPDMVKALEAAVEYFLSLPDLLDDLQLPVAEEVCAALTKARGGREWGS